MTAEALQALLSQHDVSVDELARVLHRSRAAVRAWQIGLLSISDKTEARIHRALHTIASDRAVNMTSLESEHNHEKAVTMSEIKRPTAAMLELMQAKRLTDFAEDRARAEEMRARCRKAVGNG